MLTMSKASKLIRDTELTKRNHAYAHKHTNYDARCPESGQTIVIK